MARQRKRFTREFKVEAVRLVHERGVTASQPARDIRINVNVIRNWLREHRADPTHAFPANGQQTRTAWTRDDERSELSSHVYVSC